MNGVNRNRNHRPIITDRLTVDSLGVAVEARPRVSDKGMGFVGEIYPSKCGTYQDSEFGWPYTGNGGRPMSPTVCCGPTAAS